MMKWILVLIAILIFGLGVGYYFGYDFGFEKRGQQQNVTNFEECAAEGYPVREIYPAICTTPDGKAFTQNIGNEMDLSDEIVVNNPRPGQVISSPLKLEGKARGTWLFEASAGVRVVDSQGKMLGQSYIMTSDDWMTEDFVNFTGELAFESTNDTNGTVIFENANPSGLPERTKQLQIPIKFK